jgi:hypothetical protein
MQLVESVIQLRRTDSLRDGYAHSIAEACLRLAGRADPDVARARDAAENFRKGFDSLADTGLK